LGIGGNWDRRLFSRRRFLGAAGGLAGLLAVDSLLIHATAHGAVDLALSGHTEESEGLGDPPAPIRLLLASLQTS